MTQETTNRVPELDGVRGLAILMVLFFHILKRADNLTSSDLLHTLTSPARIGWSGVDIFFVLSGFLITSILLNTKGKPNYFKNFYLRRILRIFPLYYVVMIALLIFLPLLDQDQGARTQAAWPLFMLYQQNWLYTASYREPSAFLGVTWSLAIEEQFYLVWPAAVMFLDRRRLVFVSIAVVLFSIITRVVLINIPFDSSVFAPKQFIYFGSVTRFEGLVIGALAALAFQSAEWKSRLGKYAWPGLIFAVLGFGVLLSQGSASPVSENDNMTIWGYTLLAAIGCSLIVLVTTQPENSWIRVVFRDKILAFFGKYSYAMYLLHMPITMTLWYYFTDAKRQSAGVWLIFILASFFGTIIAALLTWHLLEKHALALKKYFE